jgi:hypothetical protein
VGKVGGRPGWYPDPWGQPGVRYFDGTTWTGYYRLDSWMDIYRRDYYGHKFSGPGGWLVVSACALLLALISGAAFAFPVRLALSGTPARVEVHGCPAKSDACAAVWQRPDGTEQDIKVWGAVESDQGHVLDAHLLGDQAVADGRWPRFLYLPALLGSVSIIYGVLYYRQRKRNTGRQAARKGSDDGRSFG